MSSVDMAKGLPQFCDHMWPIRIVLVQSDEDWAGLVAHMGLVVPRPGHAASVTRFENSDQYDIVAVNINHEKVNGYPYSQRIALYAHECVHVAQAAAKIIGSKLGSEVEAYLVQGLLLWIIGECEEWL